MKDMYNIELKIGDLVLYYSSMMGGLGFGVVRSLSPADTTILVDYNNRDRVNIVSFYSQILHEKKPVEKVIIVYDLPPIVKKRLYEVRQRFLDIPTSVYE